MEKKYTTVLEIMTEFAHLTGLSSENPPKRYLWTDAFAVCNFLELYAQTRESIYKDAALQLVDQVHQILGRHREDDVRTGWISGLSDEEGQKHPTQGGLRIGKPLNERKPDDPFDTRLEWERDGQYYHYLTKWMHALNLVSRVTGNPVYNRWGRELAQTAHRKFTYEPFPGSQKRMYWKMSIDLSYPLVPSMGQHDPLDGFITYNQLQRTVSNETESSSWPNLQAEIADMKRICEGKNWATNDFLGIGGLLSDTYQLGQILASEDWEVCDLFEELLNTSLLCLQSVSKQLMLALPVEHRLAFREFGLSIGLHAIERLHILMHAKPERFKQSGLIARIDELLQYTPLGQAIEEFWLMPARRESALWREHHEINRVMLATSLAPDGYLDV